MPTPECQRQAGDKSAVHEHSQRYKNHGDAPRLIRWDGVCRGDRANVAVDLPPVLEKANGVNCGCPLFVSDQASEFLHRLVRRQSNNLGRQPQPASDGCPRFEIE